MNMQPNKTATKGKSPYVKYGKSPYRYSDELNNWTAAIKRGDKAAANRYDTAWRKKFGIGLRPDIREEGDIITPPLADEEMNWAWQGSREDRQHDYR